MQRFSQWFWLNIFWNVKILLLVYWRKGDNDYLFGLLMDYFNEQPTAYDVDVVVSELGRASGIARPVGWSHKIEIVELKTAIEIVKAGGIDGN